MTKAHDHAIGIDIGGTGMKAGIVDLRAGTMASDRVRIPTPAGATPPDMLEVAKQLVEMLGEDAAGLPIGVCFPAIVKDGVTLSAANVSDDWIGLDADGLFGDALGRDIHFVNDADAAGLAELKFGAAHGQPGLTIVTTLGTGIGSAFLFDGKLVPNSELGHLEWKGDSIEKWASASAREREDISWEEWGGRLQEFYAHVEFLFSPDLLIVGGGVSKNPDKFLPYITTRAPLVTAEHRNNAGIIGAAGLVLT
ncbi:polyphosphate--glucose phosphotransferase [Microbacterium sp. G2-8]|uniref:polyphosphate--glucose phosphotransferase n=1 Tax=Microbacterium sp. G2-8 TaxID=2842454 RepID=UPI001C8A7945|nr:ROK family protein [Microbacterium sp. G2-8]